MPTITQEKPVETRREVLVTRLAKLAPLSQHEISLIRDMSAKVEDIPAGAELYSEGDVLCKPMALMSGWACRLRMLADGRRQIFGFIVPGDMFGPCFRLTPIALTTAVTLTSSKMADASPLRDVFFERSCRCPGLASACSIAARLQEAYLLNHVVRLGRQTAYERVAHLLLELGHRLEAAGLADGKFIPCPLTQEVIADALGLSIVHVNRTLQQLRRDRLLEIGASSMRLLQPELLASMAEFRPPNVALPPARSGLRGELE